MVTHPFGIYFSLTKTFVCFRNNCKRNFHHLSLGGAARGLVENLKAFGIYTRRQTLAILAAKFLLYKVEI